jgi:HK97 family phage portal protein
MGFIASLFRRSAPPAPVEHRSGDLLLSPLTLFGPYVAGPSDAGVNITHESALACRAVYSCVTVIANALASLPIHIIDRRDGGKVYDHPVRALLDSPNPYMTPAVFVEAFAMNLLLWGNGYAFIERDDTYTPIGLYPLRAGSTAPLRRNGDLLYQTGLAGTGQALRPQDIIHTPNVTLDGIVGLSPIQVARNTIGLSVALEQFSARFFANGCNIGSVVELPPMSRESFNLFMEKWRAEYTGLGGAHKVAAAPGLKVHRMGVSPEEAQALESRKHQTLEIAGIYRCPPHKLGLYDQAHYNNVEHATEEFRTETIQPWAIKIEQELNRKLLREDERQRLQIRFNLDALVRASLRDRYAAHQTAVGGPFMTVNEARKLEGLPPITGGDEVLSPLNSAPASQRNDEPARALLLNAARTITTKEINAVARAARKHAGDAAGFRRWADEWFTDHAGHVEQVLAAPLNRHDYPAIHCEDARAAVVEAFETGTMDALLAQWGSGRAEQIVRALTC